MKNTRMPPPPPPPPPPTPDPLPPSPVPPPFLGTLNRSSTKRTCAEDSTGRSGSTRKNTRILRWPGREGSARSKGATRCCQRVRPRETESLIRGDVTPGLQCWAMGDSSIFRKPPTHVRLSHSPARVRPRRRSRTHLAQASSHPAKRGATKVQIGINTSIKVGRLCVPAHMMARVFQRGTLASRELCWSARSSRCPSRR